jgi:hypothetical protein
MSSEVSNSESFLGYTKVIVKYDEQDEEGCVYFPQVVRNIGGISCRSLTITDNIYNIHPDYKNNILTFLVEVATVSETLSASYQVTLPKGNYSLSPAVNPLDSETATMTGLTLPVALEGIDFCHLVYAELNTWLQLPETPDWVKLLLVVKKVFVSSLTGKLVIEVVFRGIPEIGDTTALSEWNDAGLPSTYAEFQSVSFGYTGVNTLMGMYHLPNVKNVQADTIRWLTVPVEQYSTKSDTATNRYSSTVDYTELDADGNLLNIENMLADSWESQDRATTRTIAGFHLAANHLFPNAFMSSNMRYPMTILQSFYPIEEWGFQNQVTAQNRDILRFPARLDLNKLQLVLVNHEGVKIVDGTWIAEINLYF